jgi:hypothetical protein
MPTDSQIRAGLKQVIQKAAPNAVVYPWLNLEGSPNKWAGKLASPVEVDAAGKARTHGYIISREADSGEWKTGNCAKRFYDYNILAFHYCNTGNETDNSDLLFNAELDQITTYLDDITLIAVEFPQAAADLDARRDPLEWDIHLDPYGDKSLHFAIGRIAIRSK